MGNDAGVIAVRIIAPIYLRVAFNFGVLTHPAHQFKKLL